MSDLPTWRDPRYASADRIRQFEEHEATIRQRERDREHRRMQPLMPTDRHKPSEDFEGAME